jgi:hypothetical protein
MNTRVRITLSLAAIALIAAGLFVAVYWQPDGSEARGAPAAVALAPAGTANVSLLPATASATAGEAVTLTIQVQGAESLGGWELELAFDPAYVELEAMTSGEFLSSTGRTADALGPLGATGQQMVGGYSYGSNEGVTGSGVLAYLRLIPLAEGQVALSLSQLQLAAVVSTTVQVQPSTGQGGQLTITAPRLVSGEGQGSDVTLTWQHDGRYTGYEVWRHTEPYFAAGAPPATMIASGSPLPTPNCTQNGAAITCRDPGVIGGGQGSYFYVVRGIRSSGTAVSFNRMGEFTFSVQPGQ